MDREVFLQVLRDPTRLVEFDLHRWDAFLPMADQIAMLPRLVEVLDAAGLSSSVPKRLEGHFESARIRSRRQRRVVYWEVEQLDTFLAELEIPIILLKGAAYLLRGLDTSLGRMYSDIDILVPKASIQDVARILKSHGWEQPEELSGQEEYFRRWMHEILPLMHTRRGTKIDVHHNILPRTDALQFDPRMLLENAEPIRDGSRICALAPVDMVLHNIVHLFRNGHYHRAFRDLLDLDTLLEELSQEDGEFFDKLICRAEELNLLTPCYLAFRYARKHLDTQIPPDIAARSEKGKPKWPPVWVLDQLFRYASFPSQLTGNENARRWSLWLLERYPLSLLRKSVLPKLERKGIVTIDAKH